jgi:PAS domain S-box-containing protein
MDNTKGNIFQKLLAVFQSLWKKGLKIGYNAELSGLDKSRIMLLNGISISTFGSVIAYSICYAFVGYQYYYGPLYIIPVVAIILYLNHCGRYMAARKFYFIGSVLVMSYWCYEGRGNGNEYIFIALAATSTLTFQRSGAVYLTNSICGGLFLLSKWYHLSFPFHPDPALNYNVLPWIILLNSVGVVSFQMTFFRDLVQHYEKKLYDRYKELNDLVSLQEKTQQKLAYSNEELKNTNLKLYNFTEHLELLVKQKSSELQTYVDAINVNICSAISSLEGVFITVNEPLIKASGYSREELVGSHYETFLYSHPLDYFLRGKGKDLYSGNSWRGEIKSKKKDGTFSWFDWLIIPIKGEENEVKCFLSIGLPITERKLNQEMRENTQAILEKVAFGTSHKIRGPLARIQGLVNLIKADLIEEEEFKMIAEKLSICTDEVNLATSDLVSFVNSYQESIKSNNNN